jgi:biopolymer transport protein ExbD
MLDPLFLSLVFAVVTGHHIAKAIAPLVVEINREGHLLVKGQPPLMMDDQIKTFYAREKQDMEKRAAALNIKGMDLLVIYHCERETRYKDIYNILQIANQAGFRRQSLHVKPKAAR